MEGRGHREIEHTADWALEVWAPTLEALIEQAARGMYELTGTEVMDGPRTSRRLRLDAADNETALVGFLEELRYLQEIHRIAFTTFRIEVSDDELRAELEGAPVASQGKEIKAVTWHGLEVVRAGDELRTKIVFDV